MYVGSFGGCIFTVSGNKILTLNEINRKTKARFAKHDIMNFTSKLEYTGKEPNEFSFKIKFLRSLGVDVQAELKMLRETCEKGLVDALVIGGENLGLYVLESIDEDVLHTDGRGVPIAIDVKLTVKEYEPVGDF